MSSYIGTNASYAVIDFQLSSLAWLESSSQTVKTITASLTGKDSSVIVGIFFRSIYAAFLPLAMFGISAVVAMGINGLLYKYIIHGTVSLICSGHFLQKY